MNTDQVAAPPLPPDLAEVWRDCMDAWARGQRRIALARADVLTASWGDLDVVRRDRFGVWLCEQLFDRSDGWHGQFGGGLRRTEAGWERPVDWALSMYPLTTRVVVPQVVAACRRGDDGRALRWLYQCLIGLAFRLPPLVRDELDDTLRSVCGPEATATDCLRRASDDDLTARRWVAQLEG